MKKKSNRVLKLFLISCFLSVFNSCDVEEEYIKTNNTENFQVKNVSFEEFKSKKNIFEKFKNTPQIIDALKPLQRIIYDDQYGVYYDTDNIIRIEKQDYISYTIPLVRETANEPIKNLVVFEKQNEPVKVKMITYTLNEEEINKIKNNEIIDISAKTSSQSLVTNSSYTNSWYDDSGCLVTATTTIIAGNKCAQGRHNYGDPCDLTGSQAATPQRVVVKYTYAFCPPDGPSSGGGPNLDPGGGGGGGGGTTPESPTDNPNDTPSYPENQDEVITTPIIPGLSGEIPEKTPCNELNKIIPNQSIQQTLRILKGQSSGVAEHGNYISETANSAGATYLTFPVIPQTPNNPNALDINAGLTSGKVKGAMHCHTNPSTTGMFPMFSAADLGALYSIAYSHIPTNNAEKDYSEYTVMLSVGSGHYALKLKNFSGDYNATVNENIVDFQKELEKDNEKLTATAASSDLIKAFLEKLNYYFGEEVGLYKATEATDINGLPKVSGWKEQTLNENGDIVEINCQ